MSWFTSNYVNENTSVMEGEHKSWSFNFTTSTLVSLYVQRTDGYGPAVYLMTEAEYNNYSKGLTFKYISSMSYDNIEYFENTATLSRGRYKLVATLPQIYDDGVSASYFSVRFEPIK